MNVVEPRLRPQDYGRANYLKSEVEHARRYLVAANLRGETDKAELLADYFEAITAEFRADTSNPVDDGGGQGDAGGQ